jgi:hypothetical protein
MDIRTGCSTCTSFVQSCIITTVNGQPLTLHSDMLSGWYASIQGLAWIRKEAIFEASLSVRMLRFRPLSERETTEAGLQSHSWHIRCLQHIDKAVCCIGSIGQDPSLLPR